MSEEELRNVKRLALDYVKLLYKGNIYSFSGHNIRSVNKICNIWTCEVNLYCSGPIVGILEINIEYHNKKEYFVTGYGIKTPIINYTQPFISEKYKDLLWKISDTYSKYTEPFYDQLIKHEALESSVA